MHESGKALDLNLLKVIAAYVSRVLIQRFEAVWEFRESDDIPSLTVGDIRVSPLARTQDVIVEGENFDSWYKFLDESLFRPLSRRRAPFRLDHGLILTNMTGRRVSLSFTFANTLGHNNS